MPTQHTLFQSPVAIIGLDHIRPQDDEARVNCIPGRVELLEPIQPVPNRCPTMRCHATERYQIRDASAKFKLTCSIEELLPLQPSCKYRNAAKMNSALRLVRTGPPRIASSSSQWACFFCQNARPQSRRPNLAEFRRNLSISRPRREPQTPSRQQATGAYMDNIRAQYNQKNMTSTYGRLLCLSGQFVWRKTRLICSAATGPSAR